MKQLPVCSPLDSPHQSHNPADLLVCLADGHTGIPFDGKVGLKKFDRLVRRTLHREVSDAEVDLLYRIFDTNRDGFLSLAEVIANETKFKNSGPTGSHRLGHKSGEHR